MNLRSIKDRSELTLEGVQIEAEYRDKSLHTLTLTDSNGKVLRVAERYSGLQALITADPEKKEVHIVTGTVPVLGTPINEAFESAYEATRRQHELENAGVIENAEVKTAEVEIPF